MTTSQNSSNRSGERERERGRERKMSSTADVFAHI